MGRLPWSTDCLQLGYAPSLLNASKDSEYWLIPPQLDTISQYSIHQSYAFANNGVCPLNVTHVNARADTLIGLSEIIYTRRCICTE